MDIFIDFAVFVSDHHSYFSIDRSYPNGTRMISSECKFKFFIFLNDSDDILRKLWNKSIDRYYYLPRSNSSLLRNTSGDRLYKYSIMCNVSVFDSLIIRWKELGMRSFYRDDCHWFCSIEEKTCKYSKCKKKIHRHSSN